MSSPTDTVTTVPVRGLVVLLTRASLDDLIGCVEVLVQEGFHTFALPADLLSADFASDFDALTSIYGGRARFGVHGITADTQPALARAAGADFALGELPVDGVAEACAEAGLAFYGSGMTPLELRDALARDIAGAQVWPAEMLGPNYAEQLAETGMIERLIPRGGLGAYAAGRWLAAGAPAACIDSQLLGDALRGGDLGALRDRCGSFLRAERENLKTSD